MSVVVLGGAVDVVGSNFVSRISLVAKYLQHLYRHSSIFFMFFTLIFGDNLITINFSKL